MTGARTVLVAAALALWQVPAAAQQAAQPFDPTVRSIMRGPELVGSAPGAVAWTDDGEWVYFRWKRGGRAWHEDRDLHRVRADGGDPERLTDEQADSLGVLLAPGDRSPDEEHRVVAYRGDLHLIERSSLQVTRLTDTRAAEASPVFGGDGRTIYFTRDDDVFALSLDETGVRQLTDIRRGDEPQEEEAEGQRAVLEEQQRELFEHIRREREKEEERERRSEAREAGDPETVYLAERERVRQLAVEPGGRRAVLVVSEPAQEDRATIVPDYVTESGYAEAIDARAKVGDAQDDARLGLLDLDTGAVDWLDLAQRGDTATDGGGRAADTAAAGRAAGLSGGAAGADTAAHGPLAAVRFLGWNDAGARGLIAAVGYDYNDQWLYALDAATGELTRIAHDHDAAWIGGPCPTWIRGCAGWLPDGERAWFLSERSGHSHLYTIGADGGDPRRLTAGDWAVHRAGIAPDETRFHLTTTEGSPFELHVYHMPLDGGERTRITGPVGRHDATPSPDGERLAVVHSPANRPPELYLMDNEPGAGMERITTSPTEEWLSYGWIEPEIVRFEARDGVRVPARIYRPGDVGAEPNGAGVIFVHGAGYLHNVHRWWSSYYREYMFHHLLASRGYTVLDIDYRGSAGYGRDWRTAIYRHMGGKDLTDQVDGARYLAEHEGVDPDRIGIYGGSYGGFITLMALFKHPETFAAGAALRSVTDWAHYNHWYTGRILNLPQDDEQAYRRSSPIYFAEGLEDPLLIAHGMVDTNVHYQDVVRLAQRLIELGKTDWELAAYPVEGHGFEEPSSWTDEYRRILELFERSLRDRAAASEQ